MSRIRPVPEKKCHYCGKMLKNKIYMKHLAEEHDDKKAAQILEELKEL